MSSFLKFLAGGDLRSTGKSSVILKKVKNQKTFDGLFTLLFHPDRVIVMRAADVIEKISRREPLFLEKHKAEILNLSQSPVSIEVKWHLAQLLPRIHLNRVELKNVVGQGSPKVGENGYTCPFR